MAVVGIPGWIGESAAQETGHRYMYQARQVLRLPGDGWMSEMAGRSKEIELTYGANHNLGYDWLVGVLASYGTIPVVVNITGSWVAANTSGPCIYIPASLQNEYIKLVIHSGVMVSGRGGDGATIGSRYGKPGGVGITNEIGGRLHIYNYGSICGGGGGGGGVSLNSNIVSAGSGGRPFGLGGTGEGRDSQSGYTASIDSPGATPPATRFDTVGGAGGDVGQNGGAGYFSGGKATIEPPGAAGAAVNGNSPSWYVQGAIYGSRV